MFSRFNHSIIDRSKFFQILRSTYFDFSSRIVDMSSPSESVDELAPPLKLPPINDAEIPPSNDVPAAASVEEEAKVKKNRNRRKNHSQKGAAKKTDANNTDNGPKQEESTHEDVETADGEKENVENAEKKARKRRPRQKPKPKAQDQTSQVKDPLQAGSE